MADQDDLGIMREHVARGRQTLWAILHAGEDCGTLLTASTPPLFILLAYGCDVAGATVALVDQFRFLARMAECTRIRAFVSTPARRRLFESIADARVVEWVVEWSA